MPNVTRHLITTADERTWKFDRPVLFLGEWCRLYDRREVWEGMDGIVATPFGIQPGQLKKDLTYLQGISRELLIELSAALNIFHNTNYSTRYWNILLGHWLQRYVTVCYNRYSTIEQAITNNKISSATIFNSSNFNLFTSDTMSFTLAIDDDSWNQAFYSRILRLIGDFEFDESSIGFKDLQAFNENSNETLERPFSIKNSIFAIVRHLLPLFSKKNDAFIISSYLPIWTEVKLQFSLGQCPQFWRSPLLKSIPFDLEMRRNFMLSDKGHSGFEQFVRQQLSDIIPICYLEGYAKLCQQAESLAWPSDPKFIFTSNNFDTDEVFKAWLGSKIELGVPYFTGQHGNLYGTLFGSLNWPELVTCDRFITWGWTNDEPKNIPSFVFKTAGRKTISAKLDGGLLLVEFCVPSRVDADDRYFKFSEYQEDQFRFVESLPESIHEQTRVRLFLTKGDFRWSEKQRWHDYNPNIQLIADEPTDPTIWDLYSQSRLVVFSYDSTGLLETLSLNIPTLCFWQDGLDYLLPSAEPHYKALRSAGIIFNSPQQAAKKAALHWDDIEKWWGSDEVQNARKLFCQHYARTEKHPVRTLKYLLTHDL
jgi:putative transferase (TIGR04331 family)